MGGRLRIKVWGWFRVKMGGWFRVEVGGRFRVEVGGWFRVEVGGWFRVEVGGRLGRDGVKGRMSGLRRIAGMIEMDQDENQLREGAWHSCGEAQMLLPPPSQPAAPRTGSMPWTAQQAAGPPGHRMPGR